MLRPERTAVIGVNGSGKTTLLNSLVGRFRHHGRLLCDGRTVDHLAPSMTGLVPQDVDFPLLLTVEECVGMAADLKSVDEADRGDAIDRALTAVDLTSVRRRRASRLSGGQQKRLACAQALVHRPGILLLDEPTAGLDPLQRDRLRQVLRQLPEERTVIVTTHILEDIAGWADRFLVLDAGRVTHDLRRVELGDETTTLLALEDALRSVPSA